MLATLLTVATAAAEHAVEHGGSKTAFYVAAGVFAGWAVLVGALGVLRPAFPSGEGGGRVVMLVSFVLMVGAMVTAVTTAS